MYLLAFLALWTVSTAATQFNVNFNNYLDSGTNHCQEKRQGLVDYMTNFIEHVHDGNHHEGDAREDHVDDHEHGDHPTTVFTALPNAAQGIHQTQTEWVLQMDAAGLEVYAPPDVNAVLASADCKNFQAMLGLGAQGCRDSCVAGGKTKVECVPICEQELADANNIAVEDCVIFRHLACLASTPPALAFLC